MIFDYYYVTKNNKTTCFIPVNIMTLQQSGQKIADLYNRALTVLREKGVTEEVMLVSQNYSSQGTFHHPSTRGFDIKWHEIIKQKKNQVDIPDSIS